jgi:hypothetical protein
MLFVGGQLGCPVRRRIDGEIEIARPVEIVFETTRSHTPTRFFFSWVLQPFVVKLLGRRCVGHGNLKGEELPPARCVGGSGRSTRGVVGCAELGQINERWLPAGSDTGSRISKPTSRPDSCRVSQPELHPSATRVMCGKLWGASFDLSVPDTPEIPGTCFTGSVPGRPCHL